MTIVMPNYAAENLMTDHIPTPDMEEEPQVVSPKPRRFRGLRNSLLTGIIVALPLFVTITVLSWFVNKVDTYVFDLIPDKWVEKPWVDLVLTIPGLGLIIVILCLIILGYFASNFIGTSIIKAGERLLARVPIVSNVYNFIKQIVATVAQQNDRSFKEVCLIEYPRPGLWAIAFVTAELEGAPKKKLGKSFVCVFVPTTPNPTSGFLLFVKRKDIKILDMTPEEGAKMIISGGMVTSNAEVIPDPAPRPTKRKTKAKAKVVKPKIVDPKIEAPNTEELKTEKLKTVKLKMAKLKGLKPKLASRHKNEPIARKKPEDDVYSGLL